MEEKKRKEIASQYDYWLSKVVENIVLTPKSPYYIETREIEKFQNNSSK